MANHFTTRGNAYKFNALGGMWNLSLDTSQQMMADSLETNLVPVVQRTLIVNNTSLKPGILQDKFVFQNVTHPFIL